MSFSEDQNKLKLITKTKAAELLGIGKEKLNSILESGKIKCIIVDGKIRIPYSELDRYINDNLVAIGETSVSTKIKIDAVPKSKYKSDFDSTNYFQSLL
jgi:excisionase family DNA binding protein